ncbi:hypothetical protein [Actinoplanes sp. NPDC048796]|uniref:hypothetical protein n=1 Tax=Actinoplanes sp. NPDC048796 TaxID=3155640 RepID=UPI003406CD25
MSDGEFWTYTGLLGFSGLVLLALCVAGLGQSGFLRGVDALLGLGFLGYAGYLGIARPDDPFTFYYLFALPVLAVIYALVCLRRVVRLRRLAARFVPDPYAGETGDAHTERSPFPTPPSPLPDAPDAAPEPAPAPVTRGPMPSGLPSRPPAPGSRPPAAAEPPGRPSGLPVAEPPAYTGRHSADTQDATERFPRTPGYAARPYDDNSSPDRGRHRASEPDDSNFA